MNAVVVTASPLTIRVPGADTANSAEKGTDVPALTAGDVVVIEVRTPRVPLVTSRETETA